MKKKGIKKIKGIDENQLKELEVEARKLKRQKLSPREEVIRYYNFFHDVLQKVQYTHGETPPSCIVHENLKDINPKLEEATFEVTEIYTKCFYGNKEVTINSLKGFRKSIGKLLSIYGIN